MWPERRGAAHASPALLSPAGLVWRLQRGALLGWAVGLLGFGLVFGALSDQIGGLEGAATEWYATFGGDADLLGAYWASMMQIAGMAVAIYVVTLLLRLHHDEAQGTLEPVLGTAVSRLRWLGAYAVNALVGATLLILLFAVAMGITGGQVLGGTAALARDLVGAALVQLPAIGVLGAAVVAVVMLLPRWSVGVSWALVVVRLRRADVRPLARSADVAPGPLPVHPRAQRTGRRRHAGAAAGARTGGSHPRGGGGRGPAPAQPGAACLNGPGSRTP